MHVPEATLQLIALMGGWPGAFLAQRAFRHKTSKFSFQCVFWTIVLIHQLAAIDSLSDWRFTKDALRALTLAEPKTATHLFVGVSPDEQPEGPMKQKSASAPELLLAGTHL